LAAPQVLQDLDASPFREVQIENNERRAGRAIVIGFIDKYDRIFSV
jgi:hypothetical protein